MIQGVTYLRLNGVFVPDHEIYPIFRFFLFFFITPTALPIDDAAKGTSSVRILAEVFEGII